MFSDIYTYIYIDIRTIKEENINAVDNLLK